MRPLDLHRLNSGLSRVASIKSYPAVRKQLVPKRTKGSVFRIGVLHGKELSENALLRNRRGYLNAQVNTVAHAPSLYHWLFHRCGIPFMEAQTYVQNGSLKVDDVLVTKEADLECQLDWNTFHGLDIQVRSPLSLLREPPQKDKPAEGDTSPREKEEENTLGRWVSAAKRALHRSYHLVYVHPGVSISSEEANPRSFVHSLSAFIGAPAALGLNMLRPIGFMDSMRGIGIATNDVSMVRYWNNEFLGNYGIYDVRFPQGVPSEVVHQAAAELNETLETGIRRQLPSETKIPCSCSIAVTPSASTDLVATLYPSKVFHAERLLVRTPLMPYRLARKMQKNGALISLMRSGPFVLPPSLPSQKSRPLSPNELALLFTFERKLKTNRLVLSLREFSADGPLEVEDAKS